MVSEPISREFKNLEALVEAFHSSTLTLKWNLVDILLAARTFSRQVIPTKRR